MDKVNKTRTSLSPIMKISEMVLYLKENNNYYNVTAYKNNFIRYQCGDLKGKYIYLDFAYLRDLSIIDYRTRLVLSLEKDFNDTDYPKVHQSIRRKVTKIENVPICNFLKL